MLLKNTTKDLLLLLGLTIVFALSFITYEQNRDIFLADFDQKLQSLDLGFSSPQKVTHLLKKSPEIIHGKLFGYPDRPIIERMDIDIKLDDYKTILKDRNQAMKLKLLADPTIVKAKISYQGKLIKAKLRLKGKLIDHWQSRHRMSFRVALKGDNYILGFKRFTIHKPESRQHPFDQTFATLLNFSGNLASVQNYIHVYVNGSDWGIMNIEEHMSKEFLEKQQKKDSLIIRLGNSQRDVLFRKIKSHRYNMYRLADTRLYSKINGGKKYLENDLYRRWYSYISKEKIKGSQLFDNDTYTKALLLASIWNDGHPLLSLNSRHYFNPYTLRLEPIVTDAFIPYLIKNMGFFPRKKFDPFMNEFIYQNIILTDLFKENLSNNLDTIIKSVMRTDDILNVFQNYFPLDQKFQMQSALLENIKFIYNGKNERLSSKDIHEQTGKKNNDELYTVLENNGLLTIYNRTPNVISLIGFVLDDKAYDINPHKIPGYNLWYDKPVSIHFDFLRNLPTKNIKIIVQSTKGKSVHGISALINERLYKAPFKRHSQIQPKKPTKEQALTFPEHLYAQHYDDGTIELFNLLPDDVYLQAIYKDGKSVLPEAILIPAYIVDDYQPYTIKTNLKGILDEKITLETSYQSNKVSNVLGPTLINSNLYNPLTSETPINKEYIIKENQNSWKIPKGQWSINEPLTINGNLSIEPGTQLLFSENAYIIVHGALQAIGTKDKPIKLLAAQKKWKGLYVFEAKTRSVLKHVVVGKTQSLSDGILNLSGGVTFYKSDIDMNHVILDGSTAEDVLNIVKSEFALENIMVSHSSSDGIDFDFSKGTINNSQINNINGDALDFSGSQVKVDNVNFKNIKDKAISAGEMSKIHITNSQIDDVGVALASKDGSLLNAENIKITNYTLRAAMTYVKKGFYDKTPKMIINKSQIDKQTHAFFSQNGTSLMVDGVKIVEQQLDIKKLYTIEIMKK